MPHLRVLVSNEDLPPPEGVNYFQLSVSGPEVQLLAGYLDLKMVADVLAGHADDEEVEITGQISHRLFLSVRALLQLKAQVDEIMTKVQPEILKQVLPPSGVHPSQEG